MIDVNGRGQPLPSASAELLEALAGVLGQGRFVVVGGAPLDLLQVPPRQIKDLDVALPHVPALVQPCLAHLRGCGCVPRGSIRRYWINLDQPVLMVDVQWDRYLIDLNFVDDIERIPQFDIEGVVWRYPERDFVDLYGAFDALERRTVRPVHGLDRNNPLLLMNRMIRLTAKYGLSLADEADHQQVVSGLAARIARWDATDDFHGRQALEAHHRSIAGAVLRSVRPAAYLADLARSGAVETSVPELHRLLSGSRDAIEMLAQAAQPQAFWSTACSLMPTDDAASLSARLVAATTPPPVRELHPEECP